MGRQVSPLERVTRWSMMRHSVDRFEAPAVVCSTELGRAYANHAAAGEDCLEVVIGAMGLTQSGRNGRREAAVRPNGHAKGAPAGRRAELRLPLEFAIESPRGRGRFLVIDLRDGRGRSVGWLATKTGTQASSQEPFRAVAAGVG